MIAITQQFEPGFTRHKVPRGSAISAVRSATAKRRRPMSSPAVRGTSAKEMTPGAAVGHEIVPKG